MINLINYVNDIDKESSYEDYDVSEKLVINKNFKKADPNGRTRGVNTVMGKDAWSKQEPKMDAWHNGTRRQNVANCSDAKLKLNYEICRRKGYTKEMRLLKAEADKRGLILEEKSLEDFIVEQKEMNDYYNNVTFIRRRYNL